jgi:hypothetical protein
VKRSTVALAALPLAAQAAATAAYAFAVRPRLLAWGSTPKELNREWPGDALTPQPHSIATRALTIDAPPAAVWPWIVQIGQDRAGFYSYTLLQTLIGAQIRNTPQIVPEFQERRVGDTVWLAARSAYGGLARMLVAEVRPQRALVLVSPEDAAAAIGEGRARHGTWALILEPLEDGRTRLVMRSRAGEWDSLSRRLVDLAFWEPIHFVMETKMMRTIKELAEETYRHAERADVTTAVRAVT